jgi:anhydro-N-acetylmuramic acid kinase
MMPDEIYLCGGGAYNSALFQCLQRLLQPVNIHMSDALGISVSWVEAAAFAWLAKQTLHGLPGNLPAVTGARGPRILGAVYAY